MKIWAKRVKNGTRSDRVLNVTRALCACAFLGCVSAGVSAETSYELSIDGPGSDRDFNDSGLTLDSGAGDTSDFFSWTAPANGTLAFSVFFSHSDGDIDINLLDAGGSQLAASATTTDDELISFAVTAGTSYVLEVRLFGTTVAGYAPDAFEPNDSLGTATLIDGDVDDDGIGNADEAGLGTDAALFDSDGDGVSDGVEVGLTVPGVDTDPGVFVADADPATATDPIDADTDGDGLLDGVEDSNANGRVDAGESNPLDPDDPPTAEPSPAAPAQPIPALSLSLLLLLGSGLIAVARRHLRWRAR